MAILETIYQCENKYLTVNSWIELLIFYGKTWNLLTVCKQISSGSFKNNKLFV